MSAWQVAFVIVVDRRAVAQGATASRRVNTSR